MFLTVRYKRKVKNWNSGIVFGQVTKKFKWYSQKKMEILAYVFCFLNPVFKTQNSKIYPVGSNMGRNMLLETGFE